MIYAKVDGKYYKDNPEEGSKDLGKQKSNVGKWEVHQTRPPFAQAGTLQEL